MSHFLQNLNNNLLCAVDTETTGLEPRKHDIIQIAIIPLTTSLTASTEHIPFIMEMQPKRPENIDYEALRVNKTKMCDVMTKGLDPWRGADLFFEWFERLKLASYKRIMPLACNWPFDREFIMDWLGPKTYDLCFDSVYRDVQTVATFLNDRAGWRGEDFPYPKVNLGYLCTQLKVERMSAHDAVDDARVTALIYGKMIKGVI